MFDAIAGWFKLCNILITPSVIFSFILQIKLCCTCSQGPIQMFQASLANDYTASVNRVIWSPDGTLCGMPLSNIYIVMSVIDETVYSQFVAHETVYIQLFTVQIEIVFLV